MYRCVHIVYILCNVYCMHLNNVLCIFHCFEGVKKLKDFQAQFAELEKERQELVNAEKLFDLPITLYSDLIEVDNQLQGMAKVFELYEAQRVRMRVKYMAECIYNCLIVGCS